MQPIVYVDTSRIRDGKLDELKRSMQRLAAFIRSNVPSVLSYGFFLDQRQQEMTVVAIHPDSASLAYHLDTGGAEFRTFADYIELLSIDVYGLLDESTVARLHQKARMLGKGTVSVHELQAGFTR